jgi:hypothetical protein
LKIGEEAQRQGMWITSKDYKNGKRKNTSLELPEGIRALIYINF